MFFMTIQEYIIGLKASEFDFEILIKQLSLRISDDEYLNVKKQTVLMT